MGALIAKDLSYGQAEEGQRYGDGERAVQGGELNGKDYSRSTWTGRTEKVLIPLVRVDISSLEHHRRTE